MSEPGIDLDNVNQKSETRMRRVLSFATITAFGFVLGKVSGILREVVVSAHYGLSSELDAYFIAYTVPTIINNVIAGSAITAAIMPTFARFLAHGDRDEFWRVASNLTNILLLLTLSITLLVMLLPAPVIAVFGVGFSDATQFVAANLLMIMIPTLVLSALLTMLLAVLNALDHFFAPALIFLALNLGIIVTVIFLSPSMGIYAVAWGFLIGVALQVVIQLIDVRTERPKWSWRLTLRDPRLLDVLRAFVPITALSVVAQINLVADKTMATTLPPGSVGALYYADSILGLFYMLGISLGIGVFPSLSRMAAENDLESTGRAVATALRLLIFVLAPLTLLLIPFAEPVIGLILGRGKFDAGAVDLTAQALVMYAIGLIPLAAIYVLQRAFYALRDSVTPFAVGVVTMILHLALNVIFMQSIAHAGIALSASLSSTAGALALTILLAQRVPNIRLSRLLFFVIECGAIALASVFVAMEVSSLSHIGTASLTARLIAVAIAIFGGVFYFVVALILKIPESRMLLDLGLGFLRRFKRARVA